MYVHSTDTIFECSNNFRFVALNSEMYAFLMLYTVLFLLNLIECLIRRATSTTENFLPFRCTFLNDNVINLLFWQK
jgi:hypothetical protein